MRFGRPRPLIRRLLMPALAAAYLGYFGFHAFHGTYGISAKVGFEAEVADLSAQLAVIRAEHADLERHVALLRNESLDPDMVDHEARANLNVIGPNEVVIVP